MDSHRHFPLPQQHFNIFDQNRGAAYYQSYIVTLSKKCWEELRCTKSHQCNNNSLYSGDLGQCCFLRYRLATSKCFSILNFTHSNHRESTVKGSHQVEKARRNMLTEALSYANCVLEQCDKAENKSHERVTLLEGEFVGAITMKIVIANALLYLFNSIGGKQSDDDSDTITMSNLREDINECKLNLLHFGETHVLSSSFPSTECEILYGRSGYLKAILMVRKELSDAHYGADVVRKILAQIWNEGLRNANIKGTELPLMWEWHSKMYLGAAHGVAGILHTLLDFDDEILVDKNKWEILESAVLKLNNYCFETGNLSSSISTSGSLKELSAKTDKLVQFCHGAPGHILLLTHLFEKKISCEHYSTSQTHSQTLDESLRYLHQSQQIAKSVVLPRGLLRKGVGLCHGISGNAYCFLSILRAAKLKVLAYEGVDHPCDSDRDLNEWINYAYIYANFALDNLRDLECVPDRPYSLFEGLVGLICLLLDLVEGEIDLNSHFPCYEF